MANRRKEDAQETRERILDAAITVFHKRGVARPSLTEIAELAGVTRGAVYGHFSNKADLFSALTDRIRLPGETLCQAKFDGDCDPLDALRTRWTSFYREISNNRQWQQILEIVVLRCEMVTESGEIHQRLMRGYQQGVQHMRELVEAAVRCGKLPASLDVDLAVPLLHGSLFGVMQDWLMKPQAFDLASIGERHVDAMIELMRFAPSLQYSQSPQKVEV